MNAPAASELRYVVTPVRDEPPSIERTAESVARQALRPVHWIVVDDSSTDGIGEVCEGLGLAGGGAVHASVRQFSERVRQTGIVVSARTHLSVGTEQTVAE